MPLRLRQSHCSPHTPTAEYESAEEIITDSCRQQDFDGMHGIFVSMLPNIIYLRGLCNSGGPDNAQVFGCATLALSFAGMN